MATNGSSPQDDATEDNTEVNESDETEAVPFRGRSIREIATDMWHKPPTPRDTTPRVTSKEVKEIVEGLDRQEMTIAIIATALDIVFTVVAYFLGWRHSSDLSTRQNAASFLLAGLVGGGLLLIGTAFRRRALLGFASFIVGFEMVSGFHQSQGVLYLAFGAWLLIRAMRKQKQNQGSDAKKPAVTTGTSRSSAKPTASKRYTPPRPTRPVATKKR